ncbi:MAG: PEGA domain-containing protein [Myxococcales bacterium]|nr:PEGA domain-containing protein [Myxococcales bacterium]
MTTTTTTTAATPTTPAPAALPDPPAAPTASTVHVRVSGQAHARVRVDGRDVGELPLELDLPSQPAARAVVVSAPGFMPWRERIAGDGNSTLAVRLEPIARATRGAHKTRAAARAAGAGAKAPAAFDPESAVPPK